jgi:YesN/AraC family two-component response regulator
MSVNRIRALIVDDRPRSRRGLRALLDTCPEIDIIGEAADGLEAVRMVKQCAPDVVLMDARMPVMDGLEATRRIKSQSPAVKVIVLTLYTTYRAKALDAGAAAFLIKGCPSDELLNTIKTYGIISATGPKPSPSLSPDGSPP